MILEHEQWYFGYDQILKDCRPSGDEGARTALLLCNADVDAMSSARILSYMLRSDGVHYQLMPCKCYSDLEQKLSAMAREGTIDSISSVVLLNFGAAFNLTSLYEKNLLGEASTKIYVMDCRRPIHLANVYSPSSVVVFLDSTQDQKDMPSDGDNLSGGESSSSSSSSSSDDDDSDSDSDNDNDDENGDGSDQDEAEEEANFDDVVGETSSGPETIEAKPESAIHESDPSYDAEDEHDGNEEEKGDNDDDEGDLVSPRESKRQKTDDEGGEIPEQDEEGASSAQAPKTSSPRELHRRRRDRLRKYYTEGSFYGSPASFVAYRLASQHRYGEKGDLLWLACVGVTDAYLHARLDMIGYAKLARELSGLAGKLYPNQAFDRALNTVYAEDLAGSGSGGGNAKTKIALSENGRIFSEKDFRFFLLRHGSLLDSMQYSDYVCTRLQLYTKKGEQTLLEMLAKMGYPLDECKQPFPFMRPSLRRRLKEKLGTHAKEYNLDHFEFTSFTRVTGYSSLLSASDTSYAVTALLEYEAPTVENNPQDSNNYDAADRDNAASIEAFNNAYDALGSHCSEPIGGAWKTTTGEGYDASNLVNGGTLSTTYGIGAGLRFAMVLQKNVIHTAVGLMERGAVALLRHFRYAHVTSSSGAGDSNHSQIIRNDLMSNRGNNAGNQKKRDHLFSKPLALTRLAHFMMDMNRENGKWSGSRARPLVMIADKPNTNTCLIVGYEYPERAGDFVKNSFGKHFEMTAKSMNGTFRFDSFDSNVVEVDAGDVQRFMEQLHYLLDAI